MNHAGQTREEYLFEYAESGRWVVEYTTERVSWSSSSFQGGYTLRESPSVDLLHLSHGFFDCFGHQACEGAISHPVHRIAETLDEPFRQRDRNRQFL